MARIPAWRRASTRRVSLWPATVVKPQKAAAIGSSESSRKYATSLILKLPTVPLINDHAQGFPSPCRYLVRVMLSAGGGWSMRGIERVLAAVLLAGAVGGTALFA